VPQKARDVFDKLSDRFDGEAMAPIAKPDRRREEYVCTACNMDLVVDVYNKLHSRDEIVFCPSCRRMLYIPDDLPPEVAIKGKPAAPTTTKRSPTRASSKAPASQPVDDVTRVLTKAAGESVRNAVAAGNDPVECEISIDGKLVGLFKGQSAENLTRTAQFCLQEAGIAGVATVVEKASESAAQTPPESSSTDQPASAVQE
jgi:hypothetical protein